jgi:hypothetical protein
MTTEQLIARVMQPQAGDLWTARNGSTVRVTYASGRTVRYRFKTPSGAATNYRMPRAVFVDLGRKTLEFGEAFTPAKAKAKKRGKK